MTFLEVIFICIGLIIVYDFIRTMRVINQVNAILDFLDIKIDENRELSKKELTELRERLESLFGKLK